MTQLYPPIEPYDRGMLDVSDGNSVYWETRRGILVNGRFDFQALIANAWTLSGLWPRAELVIVDDAGHETNADLDGALVRASDRLAGVRRGARGEL